MDFKIDLTVPILSVEEQLVERARGGKCVMGWFNDQQQFISYWKNLTYMEKLFVIDALQARLRWECEQDQQEEEG